MSKRLDVLQEVELLVGGGGPEILAIDGQRLALLLPFGVDHHDAGFAAKGRIGEDQVVARAGIGRQAVAGLDWRIGLVGTARSDAVQQQVHGAQACDAVDDLDAVQRVELQEPLLVPVHGGVAVGKRIVRGQQEAAGAAGRIADGLARLRSHDVDDGPDQGTRREVLAGATLDVLGVLLQQPLVGIPFDVGIQDRPLFAIDQIDDQAPQLGRVLNLVLGLAEDEAEHAPLFAQLLQ